MLDEFATRIDHGRTGDQDLPMAPSRIEFLRKAEDPRCRG
jgi:hypothetical protein